MKNFILVITAFIFSFAALACPNLSGTYVCNDPEEGDYYSTVRQSSINGITHYFVDEGEGEEEIIADGQWRRMEDTEGEFKMKVDCSGTDLGTHVQGRFNEDDAFEARSVVNIDGNGNLVSKTAVIYNGQALPIQTTTCQRQ